MLVKRQTGFGLLEAIVSMALLSGVGLAVFSWINGNLAAVSRLHEYSEETRLRLLASEWGRTLNPAMQSRGEERLDGHVRIRWEARPLSPMVPIAPFPGGVSTPFHIARYEVQLSVRRNDETRPVPVKMTLLGYRRDAVAMSPGGS